MKVTLIKPNIGRLEHSLYVDSGRMEPLQLGVLAALTPPDAEVVMYDDRMEPIPYDEPTDLAAITVETFTARRAYEIAAEFRQRSVPVILGGIHPTLLPEEAAQHADSLYLGDAEFLWTQVLDDCRRGRLQPLYQAPVGPPQPGALALRTPCVRHRSLRPSDRCFSYTHVQAEGFLVFRLYAIRAGSC